VLKLNGLRNFFAIQTTMTEPNYRALCAELLAAIQLYTKLNPVASEMSPVELTERLMDAMAATTAALAQPEPVAPTDEELMDLWLDCMNTSEARGSFVFARAILARWGTPANNTGGTH